MWPHVKNAIPFILCIVLFGSALFELLCSLVGHSLAVRFCTFQTMVLFLMALASSSYGVNAGCKISGSNPEEGSAALCVWLCCCHVAGIGLAFEEGIHALRMLINRHDSGIHHTEFASYCAIAELLVKPANALVLLTGLNWCYIRMKPWGVFAFHATPMVPLFLVALGVNFELVTGSFALWLDPGSALAAALLMVVLHVLPLCEIIPVLLLAAPPNVTVQEDVRELNHLLARYNAHLAPSLSCDKCPKSAETPTENGHIISSHVETEIRAEEQKLVASDASAEALQGFHVWREGLYGARAFVHWHRRAMQGCCIHLAHEIALEIQKFWATRGVSVTAVQPTLGRCDHTCPMEVRRLTSTVDSDVIIEASQVVEIG